MRLVGRRVHAAAKLDKRRKQDINEEGGKVIMKGKGKTERNEE